MTVCCQGGEGGSVGITNLTFPLIIFLDEALLCPYERVIALQVHVINTALIHLGYAILDSGIFFCFVFRLSLKSNLSL